RGREPHRPGERRSPGRRVGHHRRPRARAGRRCRPGSGGTDAHRADTSTDAHRADTCTGAHRARTGSARPGLPFPRRSRAVGHAAADAHHARRPRRDGHERAVRTRRGGSARAGRRHRPRPASPTPMRDPAGRADWSVPRSALDREPRLVQLARRVAGERGDLGRCLLEPRAAAHEFEHLGDGIRKGHLARRGTADDDRDLAADPLGGPRRELGEGPPRSSDASCANARRRSPGLRRGKPSKANRSVGSPATASAVTTALGPGRAVTVTPAAAAADTRPKPGSLTVGIPASLRTRRSSSRASSTSSAARSFSLWSCRAMSRGRFSTPRPASSRCVVRVSSAATTVAFSSASMRRRDASPRLPIGVAARMITVPP
ncbi:MAG: hypothetical protein K0R81_2178, partial [Microbacterium sp.]|nr:hypothetical protein [Microbacterium sp.]